MLESRLLTTEAMRSMIKRGTLRCPRAVNQPPAALTAFLVEYCSQSRDSKYRDTEGHPILWRHWAPQLAAQGPHTMGTDWYTAPQVQLCTSWGLLPHCHVLPLLSPPLPTVPLQHRPQ